jgi:uncharacterized protein YbjT (DUF2867 family)
MADSKETVLVTTSTGVVGTHVVKALADRKVSVVAACRHSGTAAAQALVALGDNVKCVEGN